jgi:hypothetical protein
MTGAGRLRCTAKGDEFVSERYSHQKFFYAAVVPVNTDSNIV